MAESSVVGLPIDVPDDLRTPLGAVIVVKGLDSDDQISYYICKTDDVSRVEATGMLITASDEFRISLADLARDTGGG